MNETATARRAQRGEVADLAPRYRPIRDYAAIGDCHGSALVSRDGSVDWCALRRFDANPVFCRILDADRGGFLSIRPAEDCQVGRGYIEGTTILRTVFSTAGGRVAVTDFMPVGRRLDSGVHDYVSLNAPGWLVRRIEGLEGEVEIGVRYRPSVISRQVRSISTARMARWAALGCHPCLPIWSSPSTAMWPPPTSGCAPVSVATSWLP